MSLPVETLQVAENTPKINLSQPLDIGYILLPVTTIKLPILKCKRCGHTWHPRSEKLPNVCPNRDCKSPYWNRERTLKRKVA